MSEAAVADSAAVETVVEAVVEETGIDMESAQDSLSESVFGKKEAEEVDLGQEEDELPDKEPEKEEKVEEKAEEKEEKAPEKPVKAAPQSWKKEYRELFNSADPAIQEVILLREDQMKQGLEKDRGDADLGRQMRDVMTPYEAVFKGQGIQGAQAVQYLLGAHNALSTGTVESKQTAMQTLARKYGIGTPAEGANPELTSIQQEIAQIKQNQNASHQRSQQEHETRITEEVNAFAGTHPLFDDLQDEIAKYISAGNGLEEAYKMAEKASDGYIDSEVERLIKERDKKAETQRKEELKEAKKAKSVNVKGRDTNKAPTAPKGTMLDTMHETYREIKSRN